MAKGSTRAKRLGKDREGSLTEFPTLYHRTKLDKIVEWKIWVVGNAVHVEWGEIDGKKQTTVTYSEGKNIGKANETTPEQQASLDAESQWQHRLDRKYSKTIKEAKKTVLLPM